MKKLWGGVHKMVFYRSAQNLKCFGKNFNHDSKKWSTMVLDIERPGGEGGFQNNREYRCCFSFLFKDTITNFGIIISVVLIQFVSTQSRFQSPPRHPCPAERAMTLHWTRVMQTLVTRLVLKLRIRRHIGPITLSLIFAFGFCNALCPKKLY